MIDDKRISTQLKRYKALKSQQRRPTATCVSGDWRGEKCRMRFYCLHKRAGATTMDENVGRWCYFHLFFQCAAFDTR